MIDPAVVHGKRLAMIALAKKADGADDVVVFTGLGDWDGSVPTMRREPSESSFAVPAEWLSRIEVVPADVKATLLGADYQFSVTVGNLEEDGALYRPIGLRWPNETEG